MELERVGPRLKFKAELSSKDWHAHLDQSTKHEKLLGEGFPEAKVQLDRIGQQVRRDVIDLS